MDLISNLALGFGVAVSPINLLYALIGCLLGTLIGVLPGIGPVVLAPGARLRAVAMIVLGLFFGIVGTDVNSGMARFSFGVPELTDGIGTAQIAVGVFAFAEILMSLTKKENRDILQQKLTSLMPNREEIRRSIPAVIRGTTIGSLLGILPGGGALLASF